MAPNYSRSRHSRSKRTQGFGLRPRSKTKRASVLILYTGGTFGMEPVEESSGSRSAGSLKRFQVPNQTALQLEQRLLNAVPELKHLAATHVRIAFNCDSSEMDSSHWIKISQIIRDLHTDYDGVVILHGTDTLAYTASALSLLIPNLSKPIVITGAQRPLALLRSDARQNLISAVEIVTTAPRPWIGQVAVFFHNHLYLGSSVRKRSASEYHAFDSPKFPPLANVGSQIMFTEAYAKLSAIARSRAKARSGLKNLVAKFEQEVAMIYASPLFSTAPIDSTWMNKIRALVLVIYPSGTAPLKNPSFVQFLNVLKMSRRPIVAVTDCSGLPPDPRTYPIGRELLKYGIHWAHEATPEYALVKTAYILAQADGVKRFRQFWRELS